MYHRLDGRTYEEAKRDLTVAHPIHEVNNKYHSVVIPRNIV